MLNRIKERIAAESLVVGLPDIGYLITDRMYLVQYATDLEAEIDILKMLIKAQTGAEV